VEVKVGFSRGSGLIASLICRVTRSEVSHSFFLLEDGGARTVYEAVPSGFRTTPWEEYVLDNRVLALVPMDWPHEEVKAQLDRMLGTPYALAFFVVLGVAMLFRRRPGRKLSQNRTDCVSSVCRLAREYARVELGEPLTPAELRDRLRR
jgi:hypothetical protein